MSILKNPERRGIAGLLAIVLTILVIMGIMNGYLEKWFDITWLSGPSMEDHFVYISNRTGVEEIYMQKENGKATKITDGARASGVPAVSPNARKILFVAAFKGSDSIYSIRADGKDLLRLTEASGPKALPSFSPNGKEIRYLASSKLYIAQSDGTAPKFVLPTREEQSIAITQGQETPKYRKYAFEENGKGILAASEAGLDVEQLVYLPETGMEAVKMPISPSMTERVNVAGIVSVPDTTAFIVAVNIGNNAMLAYLDPSHEKMRTLGQFENSEISAPAIDSAGSKVVVSLRDHTNIDKNVLLAFNVSGGEPNAISDRYFQDLSFMQGDTKILATLVDIKNEEKNVVEIDINSGNIKHITTDGKSYGAVYSPKKTAN